MTEFGKGDRIVDPVDPSKVAVILDGPVPVAGQAFYLVLTASQDEMMMPESELRKKQTDRASPASWLIERPLVTPVNLARALTFLKLSGALTDIIYSFSAARTLFRPHQFKPVLKVIESPVHRLLLADEVGLGKTVEAGLIWTELDARSPLRRVLIVAPSGLVAKWQLEMERRFDREVRTLTARDLMDFCDLYAERGNASRLSGIISYAQLRNPMLVEQLTNRPPTFDLAIFDEAHAMRNASTRTHQAGELITQNAEAVVFLSATPVNLGTDDLYNLLHLLRPDEFSRRELFSSQIEPNAHINAALRTLSSSFPPASSQVLALLRGVEGTSQRDAYLRNPIYQHVTGVLSRGGVDSREQVIALQDDLTRLNTLSEIYTRTRKRDLRDQTAIRRAHHIPVRLTEAEQAVYDATLKLVTQLRLNATGFAPGLAAVMPARQASSCLPAMRRYLDELAERGAVSLDLSETDEDSDDEEVRYSQVSMDSRVEALASEIRTNWTAMRGADSKFDALAKALNGLNEQGSRRRVLLFSFFRLTLDHLFNRFAAQGYRCAQMHGGTPIRERTELQRRFREGDLDILLCSEVGSEGLDFEFCDVIVNYDLPWNPMRLEQRIGRLDRFGQKNPVIHIFNFEIEGTIDSDIFLRLYKRIGVFEESIGELEPILGSTVREITRALISLELSPDEQQSLADRTAAAVEMEHLNIDRFNEQQDRLISADAFIEDALQNTRDSRRYVTPYDLQRYVAGFLRDAAHPAKLHELSRRGGVFGLQGSPLLADRLRELTQSFSGPAVTDLIQNLETSGAMEVTFDAEQAYGTTATFLGHRHPLVRAITEYYKDPDRQIHPGGYVNTVAPNAGVEGRWVFYVFLLSATGLLPQRTLFSVAARLADGLVDTDVGEFILGWLSGPDVSAMKEQDVPLFDRDAALRCYESTLEHVVLERELAKVRIAERNDALITARQESLRRELAARRSRLEELAARPGLDPRIRRMRSAQVTNLESQIGHQIEQLDASRAVTVGFRVVLGGLADLTPPL